MKPVWMLKSISMSVAEIVKSFLKRRTASLLLVLPVMLLFALALALISSSGVLAPFIYPLF